MPRHTNTSKVKAPAITPERQAQSAESRGWLALLLCGVALAGAGMLTLDHFGAMRLPGCGAGSPCARAAASVWGRIPGTSWPVSLFGLAYFTALLTALSIGRGKLGLAMKVVVGVGAVVSGAYVVVLAVERLGCAYCIVVHVANLVLAAVVLRTARPSVPRSLVQNAGAGLAFLLLSLGLAVTDARTRATAAAGAEADLADTKAALAAGKNGVDPAPGSEATPTGRVAFTGRYRFGPEQAQARVVLFTDYQCPDCKTIEAQATELMRSPAYEGKISIAIKHFPLSDDCNPNAPGKLHANACWAARAAEAAGSLGGTAGFWRMHEWLFARGGSFTDAELKAALPELGFSAAEFLRAMENAATAALVRADVDEGMSLGISMTPMIFVNGVEVRGWNAPRALIRAVDAALAASPAPAGAEADVPAAAAEKMVEDWRQQAPIEFPATLLARAIGPADSPVTIVLFGDYQEPFTADADSVIRLFATGPSAGVRYVFAHYPVDQTCNPSAQRTLHPLACQAHLAAEAADLAGGTEAFWRVHDYLMMNRAGFNRAAMLDASDLLGLDRALWEEAMAQPAVSARIASDAALATRLGLRSIPYIFVNGKHLARFKAENENIIPRVIRAARDAATADRSGAGSALDGVPASPGR